MMVESIREQLRTCILREAEFHGGEKFRDFGMLLAAPVYGGPLLKLMEFEPLFEPVNIVLGETCIVHVYTSSSLAPSSKNFTARIHHERSDKYPNIGDFIAMIVLLDDFTAENGATWYLPGSHKNRTVPDEAYFYAHAKRLIAPAGSVFYFDWRLYHAGGENRTSEWRHGLGLGITPAYHKQKIDLPRAIPPEFVAGLTPQALQKLGFYSVPPASLEEYYKPREIRGYRQEPV